MFNLSTWMKEEAEGESREVVESRFKKNWKNKVKLSKFSENYKPTALSPIT